MNFVTSSGMVESPISFKRIEHISESSDAMHAGKRLTNGFHIVHVGIRTITNDLMEINGTCLQSLFVKDTPYWVTVYLNRSLDINGFCSCSPYASGVKCMHVYAILFYFVK